jgi:glycerol-3-phosphate acyltransferase PlsY
VSILTVVEKKSPCKVFEHDPNLLAAPARHRIEGVMAPSAVQWLWLVVFYLVGSIPAGYLMGRARGIDIRQHGSGNIGATNAGRVLGRNWGLAAFACDFLKGFLPLYLVRVFCFPDASSWPVALLLVLGGVAAILGHNYTPWLGFKGGKGIATSAGVLGAILPWVLAVSLSLWIIAVLITRTVSIGSLLAAASLPLAAAWFYPHQWVYFGFTAFAGGLAAWRHRSNMERLLAGTESKINLSKKKGVA